MLRYQSCGLVGKTGDTRTLHEFYRHKIVPAKPQDTAADWKLLQTNVLSKGRTSGHLNVLNINMLLQIGESQNIINFTCC